MVEQHKTKRTRSNKAMSANLGRAKIASKVAVRRRATATDLLPPMDLDARQREIGSKRRAAGPTFAENAADDAGGLSPTVAATDCEENDI